MATVWLHRVVVSTSHGSHDPRGPHCWPRQSEPLLPQRPDEWDSGALGWRGSHHDGGPPVSSLGGGG